jgi:hypothetical protein
MMTSGLNAFRRHGLGKRLRGRQHLAGQIDPARHPERRLVEAPDRLADAAAPAGVHLAIAEPPADEAPEDHSLAMAVGHREEQRARVVVDRSQPSGCSARSERQASTVREVG